MPASADTASPTVTVPPAAPPKIAWAPGTHDLTELPSYHVLPLFVHVPAPPAVTPSPYQVNVVGVGACVTGITAPI